MSRYRRHLDEGSGLNTEQMLEMVHKNLYRDVPKAVEPVHHLEETWTEGEMVKRIVKHIYNSAKATELPKLSGQEAIKKLVQTAMERYSAACQEKKWFFEIDLVEVFLNVVWTLRLVPRQRYENVSDMVRSEYEAFLDRCLLMKGIQHACRSTFDDDVIVGKLYNALSRTWENAVDEVAMDMRPISDTERMKTCLKKWMEASMQRAWSAVDSSLEPADRKFNESNVKRLFGHLVRPFGDNHPYSCLPEMWFGQGGAPARSWPYIGQCVHNMFLSWEQEATSSSSKPAKKRKKKQAELPPEVHDMEEEDRISLDDHEEAEMGLQQRLQHQQEDVGDDEFFEDEPRGEGNPNCTSEEDCVGSADDQIVQHLLKGGKPGDRYCIPCWCSFLEQNAALEGVYEDTGEKFDIDAHRDIYQRYQR
mmetsp:Transcript_58764/g.93305  ORF Transcript_58764/g.93305 Transcript_58764/m.93305 type:complete len:419 (+) Transcript_58764:119-1375(+)